MTKRDIWGHKAPGKKYRLGGDGIFSKSDKRPAKKSLKAHLKRIGINIPSHKRAMRKAGNKRTANWL